MIAVFFFGAIETLQGVLASPTLVFRDVREHNNSIFEKAGNGARDTFNYTWKSCLKWTFFK